MAMYDVFRLHELKSKLAYVLESVAVCGSTIFLGTNEGKIIVYQVKLRGFECSCVQIETSRHRLPIRQMTPIIEKGILVVLAGDQVFAHRLPSDMNVFSDGEVLSPARRINEISRVKECKDVIAFCIKKENNAFYLATIASKQAAVFRLTEGPDGSFGGFAPVGGLLALPSRTVFLPKRIRTVNWCGKHLLLGFDKEYMLMDPRTGEVESLFPTGKSATPAACNLDPLPELVVGDDAVGVRVALDGAPVASSPGFLWGSIPLCMVYHHPYLLSVHDGAVVEVRNPSLLKLGANTPCQVVSIKYVKQVSGKGYVDYDDNASLQGQRNDIIVATTASSSIFLLEMIPVQEQALSLASSRQFDLSLALCKLCPQDCSATVVQQIQLKHGLWYFHQKKFSDAMAQFQACKADPRLVISLFPNFLPAYVAARWKPKDPVRHCALDARDLVDCLNDALQALYSYLTEVRQPPSAADASLDGTLPTDDAGMIQVSIDTALVRALALLRDEKSISFFAVQPNRCLVEEVAPMSDECRRWMSWLTLGRALWSRAQSDVDVNRLLAEQVNRCEALHGELLAAQSSCHTTEARLCETEAKLADAEGRLESMAKEMARATADKLVEPEAANTSLQQSNDALVGERNAARERLRLVEAELQQSQSKCAEAVQRNASLEERGKSLEVALEQAKDALRRSEASAAQIKALHQKYADSAATSLANSRSSAPAGVDCFALKELRDVRLLGAGGFGCVTLVRTDQGTNRLLAMKVPVSFEQLRDLRAGRALSEAITAEARSCAARDYLIASRIRHPHIVPFAGLVGTIDEPIGMLMEYVDGGSLYDAIVAPGRKPSLCEFLRIAVDLTSAVAHLHARSVWHRDIKPHNVLIDSNGHIYLADFGSASRGDIISDVTAASACTTTAAANVPQSPKYLDPQQNRAGPGDVYALGLTLLEVYLGKPLSTAQEAPRLVNREVHAVVRDLFFHVLLDSDVNDRDTASALLEKFTKLKCTYAPHATVGSVWTEELPNSWLPLRSSTTVFPLQHLPSSLIDCIPVIKLCCALSPNGAGALLRALPGTAQGVAVVDNVTTPATIPSGVVLLVRNAVLEGSFEARMRLLRSRSIAFYDTNGQACASWKDDTLVDGSKTQEHTPDVLGHRDAVMARLNDRVWKPFPANVDGDPVRVALLFHATTLEAALQIADGGFMSYARLDSGYFGKGLYFTPDFAYARDVYAADMLCDGKKVAIIAAYVCMRHVFPCVDMSMMGKSNRGGYDAHAAVVVQKSPQNAMVYQPVKNGEWKTNWNGLTSYLEVVVFDCAQALPAALFVL